MTLHPWPLDDNAPRARQPVLWKRGTARSLMIDTPALPLRFAPEIELDVPTVQAHVADELQGRLDAALLRIQSLEAALLFGGNRAAR
ncbi:hypothetical protein BH11PSE8_BH11PSE8_31210 [soil metagenome]